MLALQARSVARFGKDIDRIVIINNAREDEGIDPLYHRIQDEVIPYYGALADRVVVHDVKQLLGRTYGVQGWESQQMLKLISGSLCRSGNVTMLLDAKNYFTRPFELSTFVDGDRLRTRIGGIEEWSREQYENSCRVWELTREQIEDCAAGFPGIRTPWVIHADILRECHVSYEQRHGPFQTDPVDQYEFYIMGAFLHHRFGRIQNYFSDLTEPVAYHIHRTEWAGLPSSKRGEMLRYLISNDMMDYAASRDLIERIVREVTMHP